MRLQKILLFTILFTFQIFAHRMLMMVDDNGDGTMYIETGLSSGGSAAGAKLFVTERATGRPLWQGKVPEDGKITIPRPNVPYSVTMSMGKGHSITQKGPELLPITDSTAPEADTNSKTDKNVDADTAAAETDKTDSKK